MSHKFDTKNKDNLFSSSRKSVLPPEKILKQAGLLENDYFADIGCGNGYFSLPASEITGEGGRVFAVDISDEMLEDLRLRALKENKRNIETIKSSENYIPLENSSASIVFSCNVFHEVKDLSLFIDEIKRILKPEGKLAVVDWEKIESDKGPPKDHRLDKDILIELLLKKGFKYIKLNPIDNNFYFITAKKESKKNG